MFYCLNRIALTNHKDTQKIPFLQMFFSDGESRGISGVAGHICGEEFGVVVAGAEVEEGALVVLHMCGGGVHFVLFLTVQRYEKMFINGFWAFRWPNTD